MTSVPLLSPRPDTLRAIGGIVPPTAEKRLAEATLAAFDAGDYDGAAVLGVIRRALGTSLFIPAEELPQSGEPPAEASPAPAPEPDDAQPGVAPGAAVVAKGLVGVTPSRSGFGIRVPGPETHWQGLLPLNPTELHSADHWFTVIDGPFRAYWVSTGSRKADRIRWSMPELDAWILKNGARDPRIASPADLAFVGKDESRQAPAFRNRLRCAVRRLIRLGRIEQTTRDNQPAKLRANVEPGSKRLMERACWYAFVR